MNDEETAMPVEWTDPPKRHTEWKVVVAVVLMLVACDVAIASIESKLSLDLVHASQIPAIAEAFVHQRPAEEWTTPTLFIGNSLIREGIDPDVFEAEIFKINPDDTSVVEWRFLFSQVADQGVPANHRLVIGYAQNQLTDGAIVRPRRLGSQYLNATNFATIWSQDVTGFGERCELLLSYVSASVANAERIRTRVLAMSIPQYEQSAQRLNQAVVSFADDLAKPAPTYKRLKQIIDVANDQSIDLTIVAIPVGESFELEPGLLECLATAGIDHVDARNVSGIKPESFPDGYHMDTKAAKLFSAHVRDRLN